MTGGIDGPNALLSANVFYFKKISYYVNIFSYVGHSCLGRKGEKMGKKLMENNLHNFFSMYCTPFLVNRAATVKHK